MATFNGYDETKFPLDAPPREELVPFANIMLNVFDTDAYLRLSYIKVYVLQFFVGLWGVISITFDRPTSGWGIVWTVLIFVMFLHMAIKRHRYTVDVHDIYDSIKADAWVNIDNKVELLEKVDSIATYGPTASVASLKERVVVGALYATGWLYFAGKGIESPLHIAASFLIIVTGWVIMGRLFNWLNTEKGMHRVRHQRDDSASTDGPNRSK